MIIYESFLEKKTLVRKLLGGLSPPEPPPLPTALYFASCRPIAYPAFKAGKLLQNIDSLAQRNTRLNGQ